MIDKIALLQGLARDSVGLPTEKKVTGGDMIKVMKRIILIINHCNNFRQWQDTFGQKMTSRSGRLLLHHLLYWSLLRSSTLECPSYSGKHKTYWYALMTCDQLCSGHSEHWPPAWYGHPHICCHHPGHCHPAGLRHGQGRGAGSQRAQVGSDAESVKLDWYWNISEMQFLPGWLSTASGKLPRMSSDTCTT